MVLRQNAELHERVRRAAARTAALNERVLRRIGAELHDGPAQYLGLALLRLDAVAASCEQALADRPEARSNSRELEVIERSLQQALQEVRAISTGLGLPQLARLSPGQVIERVVREHERRTGSSVQVEVVDLPAQASAAVKITLYRVAQEALGNAYRHAGGVGQRVAVRRADGRLDLEVADRGPGFAESTITGEGDHLGLIGMRERVESLGGTFRVASEPGHGTKILARLPLDSEEADGDRDD
jgi:signal transduction histidine kinase